jgi:hypothetical protein
MSDTPNSPGAGTMTLEELKQRYPDFDLHDHYEIELREKLGQITTLHEIISYAHTTATAAAKEQGRGEKEELRKEISQLKEQIELKERFSAMGDTAYKNRDQEWIMLENKTTPSGKTLFKCNICGTETPGPTKWRYHANHCLSRQLAQAQEERGKVEGKLTRVISHIKNSCSICPVECGNIKYSSRRSHCNGKINNYFSADQLSSEGEGDGE